MATTSVTFPNIINVVLNDTLSMFISTTTVSPTVPGTFAFFKNNSSGNVLTSSSAFDAVGSFTIFCTFTPADTVTYQASSGTVIVTVHDSDAYNNYYNIPVTDLSNVLVNGNFNYIPSSIASGTTVICPTNVPGWRFQKSGNYPALLNNVNLTSQGVTSLPYPFGSKCVSVFGGNIYQPFYCTAGNYTLSAYIAGFSVSSTKQFNFIVNNVIIYNSQSQYPTLSNWQQFNVTFTIAKTGYQLFRITSVGGAVFYFGNISLKPVISNQISYLRFSKIDSQIFNGAFETEVKTLNSKTLTPLTNWTIINNAWVLNNYSVFTQIPTPYPSGNQCIAIEGLGKITQTFNYINSSLNYLSFYVCAVSDLSMNQIKASINGATICNISQSNDSFGIGSGSWQKVLFTNINTVAGPNTLTIEGLTNTTGFITAIDNVVFGSVNRATPTITYSSSQTNTYGTPLIANMNAACSVPATFQYYLDATYTDQIFADSTLPVGTYTVYVVATPLDTYNISNSFASASLTVVSPNAQIVFPNIINVVLNDTLSTFLTGTTVSPSIAGTFTFQKTNSSGAVLTSSSVFDASGNYTIFCTFTPTESAAVSASYTVFVQDKDVWNNYYNIPVTDTTNMIVNGNFNYLPTTIPSGTSATGTYYTTAAKIVNVPGWSIGTGAWHTVNGNGSYVLTEIYNNVNDPSLGSFPYPFGTNYIRVRYNVYQTFYAVAGTYTLSFYAAVKSLVSMSDYCAVNINSTRIYNINNAAQLQPGWQLISVNFTVTTGMHNLFFNHPGGPSIFVSGISIKPVTNPVYLRFSKINSLISNGIFETEVKTANSKSLTPITNWNVVTNNVWVLNNFSGYGSQIPYPYPSGKQCVAIEALGKITQTFTATASTSNFLSFYACSVLDTSTNQIRASINNTTIFDNASFTPNTWSKFVFGGITTVNGTNTLTFEGKIPTANFIVAIDNVIFGQVTKETPVVSFGPKTDYPFIPIQNNTVNSNAFTATGNGAHNGLYEFTASSSRVTTGTNVYMLADNDNLTGYHSSHTGAGSPVYYSMPYASNGTYQGATDVNGNLAYYWTTNVVGVGTISGEWVQYKLPHPIQLTKYGLMALTTMEHRFPRDYYILGSVDGNTWYSIKSVTNSEVPTWPNMQFTDVSYNTKLYSYYRLVCSKLGATGTLLNFTEFSLFGDNTKNYYGTPIGANLNSSFDISGAHTYFLDAALTNQVYSTTTLPIGDYTIYNRYISNDTVNYLTSITSAPLSVVMPPSSIVFPAKTINVVYNNTLAEFIAGTSVSPSVAGTLTFYKTNSSGAVLTASSVFDTVGNFTIFVSFAPTDYVNNFPCSGSYTVSVEDKDAYNNYYNIPVTDLSNVLVNGKFEVNPFAATSQTVNPTNVPGWRFGTNYSYLMNNFSQGAVSSFPPPFGNTYIRLANTNMYQMFYAIAGTYTFTTSYCNTYSYPNGYVNFYIDNIQLLRFFTGTVVGDWTTLSHTFTIATTGMHMFCFFSSSNNFFFGDMKILPVSVLNNVSYMKFSKINSQIFNGTFETEIKLANSRTSTPLANWTTENTGVWVLNNFTSFTTVPRPYPSGNQCVGIQGLGKISQTFNHIDSSFNYLSFYLSITTDASLNPIIVKMNNTQIAMASTQTSQSAQILFGVWSKYIYTNITTVAGPNTLSIEGTDATNLGKITMIDNVIFGSMNMSPIATTYAPPAIIKYGSPLAPLLNATCNVPATITYYLDSALTNQVFADSTLPIGNYGIYVKFVPLDTYIYLNSFASTTVSIVDPNPAIVFPKVINVVYNDTLSAFINYTTVVPNTAGTFVFTNSSGDILTTSSVYNAVGKFTIFCTFTPDNTTVYETTSASYSVTVEDNDAPNNYFNIPVTDTTNLLVNGNFEYVPATYPPGTNTSNQPLLTATNIPGWRFFTRSTGSYSSFINDVLVSSLVTYPFPNGPKCASLRSGQIYQPVFLNAGIYTFSCYVARSTLQLTNSYFRVYIDSKLISGWSSDLQSTTNWRYYSTTFTVSTTTTYNLLIEAAGGPTWFFQKMSIVPTIPNPQYLKFSKIDSQIFNGSFESEIKTANSISNVALSNWSKQNTVWVLNNYSSYISIPLPYPSGNQCAAIEKTGKVTQDFTYSASNLNYLSFYVCGDASSNPLTVKLNDISVCTINYFSTAGGTWQKCIYPYLTTVTGTNTLSFEGTTQTNGFIGIDNVIFGQVNRATTSVSFPTPSPIMYGTDLSAVLVATGSVPGSIRYYTDASYSVQVFSASLLIPSMYSIYARFIPSDQVNYLEGFATVDLSVNKLVPLLNYPTLPAIDYGTLLESSLIATTNIPSKIEYYLDATRIFAVNNLSVLAPGNYTIYAHLNPTDNVTYSTLFTSSSLTVNPSIIRPTMYYPSSPPITYGTNLTNMLNASIVPNVPGAIRYYTDASYNNEVTTYTILQPGIWTVYAIFTPTDATECTLATGKTTIFISNVSVETRKLVLSTADIMASTNAGDYFGLTISNAAGTVENNRYTYTWHTNIRSIMGDDFYNRYNIFSIQLKEFVNGDLFTSTQPSAQNLSVHYEVFNECKLSGIQFSPAPLVNGVTSNQATMCVLTRKFPASSPSYHNMRDSVGGAYTFSKTADTVPIKIDLPNLYDDQYFAPSVNAILFGHLTFVFEIRGVLN